MVCWLKSLTPGSFDPDPDISNPRLGVTQKEVQVTFPDQSKPVSDGIVVLTTLERDYGTSSVPNDGVS